MMLTLLALLLLPHPISSTCASPVIVSTPLTSFTLSSPKHAPVPVSLPHHVASSTPLHPYVDFAELNLSALAYLSFTYSTTLPPLCPSAQLHLSGADTISHIATPDAPLTNTTSAYLSVIHPLIPSSAPTPLSISISPSLDYASSQPSYPLPLPHTVNYHVWDEPSHRNRIRKPGSDFGWDWGPAFPQASLRGPVLLEQGAPCALKVTSLRVLQTHSAHSVRLSVHIHSRALPPCPANPAPLPATLALIFNGKTLSTVPVPLSPPNSTVSVLVPSPLHLWFPVRLGPQPLYTLLLSHASAPLVSTRIGLKTTRLVRWTAPSTPAFTFVVNDRPLNVLGANYVPADALHDSPSLSRALLYSAVAANHNTVRVWGGGRLPPDSFYELCDELGLLVWQDLPYACAVYPTDNLGIAAAEATSLILRLQSHACLLAWGGNNEVEASLAWFPETMARLRAYQADYVKLFIRTFLPLFNELDPDHPYIDSSPSNGFASPHSTTKVWGDVTDPTRGDVHFYDYSMRCEDPSAYPQALFVSEHGVQSLPISLPSFVSSPALLTAVLESRQRHARGFAQMRANARRLFPHHQHSTSDYSETAYLSHLVQATCLETAVWAWRSGGLTSGVLLWQLNDAWPGVSWSMVEYGGQWKAAMYRVKQSFARVALRAELGRVRCVGNAWADLRIERFRWNSEIRWPVLSFKRVWCDGQHPLVFDPEGADACRVTARYEGGTSTFSCVGPPIGPTMGHVELVAVHGGRQVILRAPRWPQAYVWVEHPGGYFEPDNGFHFLPNETRVLTFVPYEPGQVIERGKLGLRWLWAQREETVA